MRNLIKKVVLLISCVWLFVVGITLFWNIHDQKQAQNLLAFQTARAFFNQVVVTRSWNSLHGGLYVPITKETQPNMYLEDPLRDLTTIQNIALTKINPAFMTRQISEISSHSKDGIQFHITSLNPIRPENKALAWEKKWLETFEQGATEQGAFLTDGSKFIFRYMAPLAVEDTCLKCHAKQGYKKGDIRGGISVTLPNFSQEINTVLIVNYGIGALLGIILIVVGGRKIKRQQMELLRTNQSLQDEMEDRQKAFDQWKEAADEVQQLKGIVPICMHCKEIRDDSGFWNRLEHYIETHSEAQFSHSICEKCLDKYYPGEDEAE